MYELIGVTKQYRRGQTRVDALAGVDLTLDQGDRLVIQGPTGGGKSTLLQMLGGLDRPTTAPFGRLLTFRQSDQTFSSFIAILPH